MSNYPPGVSGNEYEIAGPDWEQDSTEYCEQCRDDQPGMFQGYRDLVWFICYECGEITENSDMTDRLAEMFRRKGSQ